MRYITPERFLLSFGMRKLLLITVLLITCNVCFSQTRKTRSDKGKTHKHSAKYYTKKAITPKSTKTKKKK